MSQHLPSQTPQEGNCADQREREADELARRSDKLKDEVSNVRQEWQEKRASAAVPGAVPEVSEEDEEKTKEGAEDAPD